MYAEKDFVWYEAIFSNTIWAFSLCKMRRAFLCSSLSIYDYYWSGSNYKIANLSRLL